MIPLNFALRTHPMHENLLSEKQPSHLTAVIVDIQQKVKRKALPKL